MVTHGGMGATQKALANGVPVVAVPFGRDQLEVARRVEVAGAGVRLPSRRLSAARLESAVREAMSARVAAMPRTDRTTRLMLDGTARLVDTLDRAPVIVFVTGGVIYPPTSPREAFTWSALYPAAQNILLAARALGLGAVMTTLHHGADATIREVLGIPEHIRIAATIPVGWPDGVSFGPVNRRPVDDFVHRNRWEGDKRGPGR